MAFKFIIFAAVIAATRAGVLQGPIAYSTSSIAGSTIANAGPLGAPLAGSLVGPLGGSIAGPFAGQLAGRLAPRLAAPLSSVYPAPLTASVQAPVAYSAPAIARFSSSFATPITASYAAPIAAAPIAPVAKAIIGDEYDPNPQYQYGYDIQDGLTGDSKSQVESRSGDVVQGSYSLNDPDGTRRTVDYTADPINGFNAVVRKEPLVTKAVVAAPTIAKVAAPLSYAAAPISARVAAPITYSAPAASLAYPVSASPLAYASPAANLGFAAPSARLAYAGQGASLAYGGSIAQIRSPLGYAASPAFAKVAIH